MCEDHLNSTVPAFPFPARDCYAETRGSKSDVRSRPHTIPTTAKVNAASVLKRVNRGVCEKVGRPWIPSVAGGPPPWSLPVPIPSSGNLRSADRGPYHDPVRRSV